MVKVIFAGTPDTAIPSLQQLVDDGHDVVAVLTRTDAPVGRKRVMTPSPVAQHAEKLGLEVLKADRFSDDTADVVTRLAELNADVGAVVAYGALIPEDVLTFPAHGWINLHFSRLPAYRGASPVQSAIINEETTTGADVFQLETGLDTGPVFASLDRDLVPGETAGEVLKDLAHTGARLLSKVVTDIGAGTAVATPQEGEPTWAPKLTGRDGLIDPAQSAGAVLGRINGTTPEPGAWAMLETATSDQAQRLKLGAAAPAEIDVSDHEPGTIVAQRKNVYLVCADGAVELKEVQPAGKKMMRATDWARGAGEGLALHTSTTHPETF